MARGVCQGLESSIGTAIAGDVITAIFAGGEYGGGRGGKEKERKENSSPRYIYIATLALLLLLDWHRRMCVSDRIFRFVCAPVP